MSVEVLNRSVGLSTIENTDLIVVESNEKFIVRTLIRAEEMHSGRQGGVVIGHDVATATLQIE